MTTLEPLIGQEAHARSVDSIEAWALFFNTFPMRDPGETIEIPVQTEVKIVWRITGDGDLEIEAAGPDGSSLDPDWGPEEHLGSNWDRLGDEWGTSWTFPDVGCWTFHVRRGNSEAQLSVNIHEGSR